MQSIISNLLSHLDINPVLLDIGASAFSPKIWESLAPQSTYIGFDPDLREIHEERAGIFSRSVIINEAVTADKDVNEVTFYLTASPYCSSTLEPDPLHLSGDCSSGQTPPHPPWANATAGPRRGDSVTLGDQPHRGSGRAIVIGVAVVDQCPWRGAARRGARYANRAVVLLALENREFLQTP